MKRVLRTLGVLVVLLAIGAGAWFGWGVYRQRSAPAAPDLLATAPAPCPDDPNDLAGIEGWAPGAGQASKIGQTGTGNIGTFGGGLGGDSSTPAPDANAKKCTGISARLDRYFARIAATGEAIPSTGYDASARAAVLDAAPDAGFAFVRDRIATDGYAGSMRGANGTLAAQSGSPADKALLLAALLAAKQVPVRFVHGTLSDAETDVVIHSMLAVHVTPDNADPETLKKLGLTAAQVAEAGNEQRERVKALADEGIARARSATDALLASAPALAASDDAARNAWKVALKDHWWLQAQQNGAWSDLDPTLPDAKAGAHLGTAAGDPADALPDTQYATVAIRLVGTFAENGATSERTLLSATAKTADLALSAFSLVIGDHDKGAQNLTEARSFTPSITLGGAGTSGDAFAPDGTGPRLATLRLQIVTQLAGGQAHTAERTLVDRRAGGGATIDPAWTPERTALALTATYMGLVVSGELNRDFTAKQDAQSVKLARAFAAYNAAGGNGRQLPPPGIAEAYPYEVMHYFLYDSVARMRLEDASNGGLRFFFDRPQVAMVHRGFTQRGKTRSGVLEFDIVDNGMAVAGAAVQNAARANAVRGYLDTSIERHVLGVEPAANTIALFDAAAQAGVKPRTDTRDPAAVRIVPNGNVSLGGRVVSGWWQLDPQTGNMVGRMAGGAGQAMVEYAIDRINDWSSLVSIMQFYGDFFRCIAMGVESPLSGGANPQAQFNNCALGAICALAESTLMGEAFSRCTSCTNIDALIYNFLDYGTYGKSSSPGSFGYVCGKLFPSPF